MVGREWATVGGIFQKALAVRLANAWWADVTYLPCGMKEASWALGLWALGILANKTWEPITMPQQVW